MSGRRLLLVSVLGMGMALLFAGCGGSGNGGGSGGGAPTEQAVGRMQRDSEQVSQIVGAQGMGDLAQVAAQAQALPTVEWAEAEQNSLTVKYKDGGLESWISTPMLGPPSGWESSSSLHRRLSSRQSKERVGGLDAVIVNSLSDDPGFADMVNPLMNEADCKRRSESAAGLVAV